MWLSGFPKQFTLLLAFAGVKLILTEGWEMSKFWLKASKTGLFQLFQGSRIGNSLDPALGLSYKLTN